MLLRSGQVYLAIRWAIKVGYRMIDCADIYGNEKEIGQAIKGAISEGDVKREDLFIVSKLWNDSHDAKDVRAALEQSLKDLELDYLDLYLMHWPVAQKKGIQMPQKDDDMISLKDIPLETTWKEMEKAYNDGLVKAIGVSNFGIKNLERIMSKSEIIPAINQVECHPYLQQDDLVDFCHKNNIAVMAYSSLGSLKSEHKPDAPELLSDKNIIELAQRLHIKPSQVILSWLMNRGIIVIPKSVHEEYLKENFAAQAIILDEADMQLMNSLNKDYRYIDGKVFEHGD